MERVWGSAEVSLFLRLCLVGVASGLASVFHTVILLVLQEADWIGDQTQNPFIFREVCIISSHHSHPSLPQGWVSVDLGKAGGRAGLCNKNFSDLDIVLVKKWGDWVLKGSCATAFMGLVNIKQWLKLEVPQKVCPPGTCECDFIWKRRLWRCNQIKDLEMGSSVLELGWALTPMTCIFLRDRKGKNIEKTKRGKDWGNYAATRQRMPRPIRSWKRQGSTILPETLKGVWLCPHFDFRPLDSRTERE